MDKPLGQLIALDRTARPAAILLGPLLAGRTESPLITRVDIVQGLDCARCRQ